MDEERRYKDWLEDALFATQVGLSVTELRDLRDDLLMERLRSDPVLAAMSLARAMELIGA